MAIKITGKETAVETTDKPLTYEGLLGEKAEKEKDLTRLTAEYLEPLTARIAEIGNILTQMDNF